MIKVTTLMDFNAHITIILWRILSYIFHERFNCYLGRNLSSYGDGVSQFQTTRETLL